MLPNSLVKNGRMFLRSFIAQSLLLLLLLSVLLLSSVLLPRLLAQSQVWRRQQRWQLTTDYYDDDDDKTHRALSLYLSLERLSTTSQTNPSVTCRLQPVCRDPLIAPLQLPPPHNGNQLSCDGNENLQQRSQHYERRRFKSQRRSRDSILTLAESVFVPSPRWHHVYSRPSQTCFLT